MRGAYSKRLAAIIAIAFLLVNVTLLLGFRSFKATEQAAFDEFNRRQLVLAKEATGTIELYFEHLAGHLRTLARCSGVQRFDQTITVREIEHAFHELEPWDVIDIAVLDNNGVIMYSVGASEIEGVDVSWTNYVQEAKASDSDDFYSVEFIPLGGMDAGEEGILIAVPIWEMPSDGQDAAPADRVEGMVVSTFRLDAIVAKTVALIQSSQRGHAFLIDGKYHVLWSPDRSQSGKNLLEETEGFPAFQQVIKEMIDRNSGTAEYSYYKFDEPLERYRDDSTEEDLIAFAPVHFGGETLAIGVWAPTEDARELIQSVYLTQMLVVGLALLTILLGCTYILAQSHRTSKYLEKQVEIKVGELKESEERYRSLVELSPDAIAIQSEDEIVFVNSAGVRLLGVGSPKELVGQSVWDFVLPEFKEIVKARYRQMREDGQTTSPIEQQFVRPDGTFVDVEVSATPFIYRGKPAIQAIFHDISVRKQAVEALRVSHAFQQSIIDSMAEPLIVVGADYRVRLTNRAAREFWPVPTDPSLPRFCYEISHGRETPCAEQGDLCPMEQVRESGQPVTVLHEHYQEGQRRFVEIVAAPLWGADGSFDGIVECLRDITERKWMEETLVERVEVLTRSHGELEQFSYKVIKSIQDFFAKLPPDGGLEI